MTSEGTDAAAAVPVDTTGDGIADSMGYDTTGDGKIDAVDQNGDGKIDYTFGYSFASIGSIMNPTPNPEATDPGGTLKIKTFDFGERLGMHVEAQEKEGLCEV